MPRLPLLTDTLCTRCGLCLQVCTDKAILPFRIVWVLAIPFGAVAQLDFAWLVADTLNGLMALPNLLSLLLLSPVVVKLTREYFARQPSAVEAS